MSKSCLAETVYQIIHWKRHWQAHLVSIFDLRQYCHQRYAFNLRNGSVTWEFIHSFSEITCTLCVIRQLKYSWEPARSVFLRLAWRWGRDILSPSSPTGETRGAGWHKPSSKQVCWSISSAVSFSYTFMMDLLFFFHGNSSDIISHHQYWGHILFPSWPPVPLPHGLPSSHEEWQQAERHLHRLH